MSNDWAAVEAAAQRAGWEPVGALWRGPCPVTGEEYCTVEPASANDGVLMRCSAPSCKAVAPIPRRPPLPRTQGGAVEGGHASFQDARRKPAGPALLLSSDNRT